VFRYALVTTDGEALGEVAFAVPSWQAGDVIPQGAAGDLRVVQVLEPERQGRLPVLVVEPAGPSDPEKRISRG
jgi:hypothetical protein